MKLNIKMMDDKLKWNGPQLLTTIWKTFGVNKMNNLLYVNLLLPPLNAELKSRFIGLSLV